MHGLPSASLQQTEGRCLCWQISVSALDRQLCWEQALGSTLSSSGSCCEVERDRKTPQQLRYALFMPTPHLWLTRHEKLHWLYNRTQNDNPSFWHHNVLETNRNAPKGLTFIWLFVAKRSVSNVMCSSKKLTSRKIVLKCAYIKTKHKQANNNRHQPV